MAALYGGGEAIHNEGERDGGGGGVKIVQNW